MARKWQITIKVPCSEAERFHSGRLEGSDKETATFQVEAGPVLGSTSEIKDKLGGYEVLFTENVGLKNFSLEATPLRER